MTSNNQRVFAMNGRCKIIKHPDTVILADIKLS